MRSSTLSATLPLIGLLWAGCWKVDAPEVDFTKLPFAPEVGAPDGWRVEQFDMALTCPDGEPARMYAVFPEALDRRVDPNVPSPDVAIVFHSGAFDYVFTPTAQAPIDSPSFQGTTADAKRLTSLWAYERTTAALGLFPNFDDFEVHVGALPAALAEQGIASLWPTNCWGDLWHNRQGEADNDYSRDRFFRDGRTAAEFAWLYATQPFPASNPTAMPFEVSPANLYLVGLGEGARAVSELLAVRGSTQDDPAFLHTPAAVVLDSPADDLRPYYDLETQQFQTIEAGMNRLFPEGRSSVMAGSMARVPAGNVPDRIGLLWSSTDTLLPAGTNTELLDRLDDLSTSTDIWIRDIAVPRHVLSNGDPELAAELAAFLVSGTGAEGLADDTDTL